MEFREALRRSGNTKLGTGLSSNPHLQTHPQHVTHGHGQTQSLHVSHPQQHQHQGQQHGQLYQAQHQGQYQGHGQHSPPPPPPSTSHTQYSTNNSNNLAHAQGHLLSPNGGGSNNNVIQGNPSGSHGSHVQHNGRTRSMPNLISSFGDLSSSQESKGLGAHAHAATDFGHHNSEHFNMGYGSGGSANNSHNGSVSQNYHFGGGHNGGGGSGGHSSHHQPPMVPGGSGQQGGHNHSLDYLSTADTSDGEDIPVLEIDLSH